MPTKVDTVTARDRLKARREPYWHRIERGCYLGFRKMTTGSAGTWVARAADPDTRKQAYKSLGEFADLPAHERFDAATKTAREWFDHLGRGGRKGKATIRDVCSKYVDHLRETRGDRAANDAIARFDAYVLNSRKLADTELAKLTPLHVEAWRKALRDAPTASGPNRGERRSPSTLNRDMTCFRAALNLAYRDGFVTSDFAWKSKLLPIKNADRRRELYLDREQRRKMVDKAEPDLALFLRAMSLLPLRPGALAGLTVADFDRRLGVLRIGKDKAGADRRLKLPTATAAFMDEAAKGKLPAAPLLSRADGQAWNKDAWKWPVKAAVTAAELPEAATAYALRHSTITDLVTGGLDLLTVAQISGTSVKMIEAHYGHLRADHAAAALAMLV